MEMEDDFDDDEIEDPTQLSGGGGGGKEEEKDDDDDDGCPHRARRVGGAGRLQMPRRHTPSRYRESRLGYDHQKGVQGCTTPLP